ncbi:reverse transcriptase [Phytophthora megakarya]|uniref:Reverse transcriptase n=1 Tax=Phytophthora megakarya TaxID=4795 RepID=A0A225UV20_9STRA|nr:reverse transcriptase [Phytophthora megakarya]
MVCQLWELRHTALPKGVEVTTKHRLRESMRQVPGCTKQGAIKPGLMTRARGYKNPPAVARRLDCLPAVSRNVRPWPGLDETQVNQGFTRRSDGASTTGCASLGEGPRPFMTQMATMVVETLNVLTRASTGYQYEKMELENPPTDASELTSLPVMSWKRFAKDLYDGRIERLCILSDRERMTSETEELSATESEDTLSAKTKKERFKEQSWDSLKSSPYYEILREHRDVLPDEIPAELLQVKGIQHEIDLVPGTKYCVTRQWPLPREQVKAINDFFEVVAMQDKSGNQSPAQRTNVLCQETTGWLAHRSCVQ